MRCIIGFFVVLVFAVSHAADRPNAVLIYIDDLGYGDIGPFGCEDIPTPHLDRLAKEGVVCTTSYITNPPCCPSRCALIMGQYGQRFGKYGMSRGLAIPDEAERPTLAKYLSGKGYATGQVGKWDIGTKQQGPLQVGFGEVARRPPAKQYSEEEIAAMPKALRKTVEAKKGVSQFFCIDEQGEEQWLTDYDGDRMVDFIERHRDEPFFLYWSPLAVHSKSIEAPERLKSRTTAPEERRALAGAICAVDDQVGKLFEVLEAHDLREETLIIFSSDNGANIGEYGTSTPYTGGKGAGTQKEGWVRVPTIFSLPGQLPQGETYAGMMANFDFYSTIASYTCGEIPEHCDGVDLFPWLQGKKTGDAHKNLFWLNNEPGDAERRHLIAARWQDWRLYKKYEADAWQLFDLKNDPTESTDLAAEHPDVVKKMAKRHADWAKTLAPLGETPTLKKPAKPTVPKGHGWETASAE